MAYLTIGAVMLMQVVLGCFHGEDDLFDKVPVTDSVVDEVAVAVGTGIQPTALHDIDGGGLLPTSTLVHLLPSSSSRLVRAGLVLVGRCASNTALLTID